MTRKEVTRYKMEQLQGIADDILIGKLNIKDVDDDDLIALKRGITAKRRLFMLDFELGTTARRGLFMLDFETWKIVDKEITRRREERN